MSTLINDVTTSTGFYKSSAVRKRTIILAAQRLKPNTDMWLYMSNQNETQAFCPATRVKISMTAGKFLGVSDTQKCADNLTTGARTVSASYDVLEYGEVIKCTTGTAIVVADEVIYNSSTLTSERILYVVNVKGTLSGTITGSISNVSTAVISSTFEASRATNSLGNLYGTYQIPENTFISGVHKISISDDWQGDVLNSTTSCETGYYTEGTINTFTRTQTFETVNVVNQNQTITKTVDQVVLQAGVQPPNSTWNSSLNSWVDNTTGRPVAAAVSVNQSTGTIAISGATQNTIVTKLPPPNVCVPGSFRNIEAPGCLPGVAKCDNSGTSWLTVFGPIPY